MACERHEWFLNQIFRHRTALYRYLRKFTSGAEEIEDLVQETYVRVYALSHSQAVDSPRALLFRIAHNTVVASGRAPKNPRARGLGVRGAPHHVSAEAVRVDET